MRGRAALVSICLMACGSADGEREPSASPDAGLRMGPDATQPVPTPYPDPDWAEGSPGDHELDPAALESAAAYADSIGSRCLLVIRDGRVVFERYFNGSSVADLQRTWSIAKSFTSTLVGIAIDRGEIQSVDQPVSDFIPAWRETDKAAITVRHLLSMNSGLKWDLVSDNTYAMFTDDQTADALAHDADSPPGTVWKYTNRGVQVLDAVLEAATGLDPERYAEEHLWGPIGMDIDGEPSDRTHWDRDGAGNATLYMSVFATCRDLGRLGYLFLHDGRWNDTQVVSEAWVREATTPSQPLNRVYGYLWWVNGDAPGQGSTDQPFEGTLMDFAPDDLFGAQGLGQTFIDVVPSTNTVYVHVRPAPHDPFTKFLTDPAGTIDALTHDGMRVEHKELMRALLHADAH